MTAPAQPEADTAARLARAINALEWIRDKAGSHTVSQSAVKAGVNDPGFAGIHAVAVNVLHELKTGETDE